ncbi:MAG: hypothetical protein HOQ05_07480 [Corynebacteriales bacterium]|nr:hypothetical protein [Mycobacteriales bacterium]
MMHGERTPLTDIVALTEDISTHRHRVSPWSSTFSADQSMIPAAELFHGESSMLSDALDTYARAHRTDRRIAASQLWKNYTYWMAVPAVAGWVAHRQVLDLSENAVAVRFTPDSPYMRFGMLTRAVAHMDRDDDSRPSSVTLTHEDDVLEFLATQLIVGHFTPAVDAFRALSGLGTRILWGSVAVALTHPVSTLSTLLRRDFSAELRGLQSLLGPNGRLVDFAPVRDDAGNVETRPLRRTCCQKMRIPGSTNCVSCPLLSPARRAELSARKGITWLNLESTAPATL